jgi:hypothetical protein
VDHSAGGVIDLCGLLYIAHAARIGAETDAVVEVSGGGRIKFLVWRNRTIENVKY